MICNIALVQFCDGVGDHVIRNLYTVYSWTPNKLQTTWFKLYYTSNTHYAIN